ncbi:MAG: hypothetical protein R6T91_08795 [Bacteroidales bacterium]
MKVFQNKEQEKAYRESPVLLQVLMLFLLAVGLYLITVGLGYSEQDRTLVLDNPLVQEGSDPLSRILFSDSRGDIQGSPGSTFLSGQYRPLAIMSYVLEKRFVGHNAFVAHWVNILIYAFIAAVLFLFLRVLFKFYYQKPWYLTLPLLAAALYIVHPLHSGVVAHISQRDELLAMFWSLLSLHFVLLYIDHRRQAYLVLIFISYFLALLSKEISLSLLLLAPLMVWVFRDEPVKKILILLIPMVVALFLYGYLRMEALGFGSGWPVQTALSSSVYPQASAADRFATLLFAFLLYLRMLFFPVPLEEASYIAVDLASFHDPLVYVSFILWGGIILFALIKIWHKDVIAFCILLFLITFAGYSNVFFTSGSRVSEQYMFFPSLSVVIIASYFINQTLRRLIKTRIIYKRLTMYLVIVLLIAASAQTIHRNLRMGKFSAQQTENTMAK